MEMNDGEINHQYFRILCRAFHNQTKDIFFFREF